MRIESEPPRGLEHLGEREDRREHPRRIECGKRRRIVEVGDLHNAKSETCVQLRVLALLWVAVSCGSCGWSSGRSAANDASRAHQTAVPALIARRGEERSLGDALAGIGFTPFIPRHVVVVTAALLPPSPETTSVRIAGSASNTNRPAASTPSHNGRVTGSALKARRPSGRRPGVRSPCFAAPGSCGNRRRASARCSPTGTPHRAQCSMKLAGSSVKALAATAGRRPRSALFRLRVLLGFGDQLLDFLTTLVADLLIEIRTVLILDDLAAFLADRFVELRAVALARHLTALAAYLFVEPRSVPIPDRVPALLPCFSNRHIATGRLLVVLLLRFARARAVTIGHEDPYIGPLSEALRLRTFRVRATLALTAFLPNLLVKTGSVLALRCFPAFATD